jgi:hypothetical protein
MSFSDQDQGAYVSDEDTSQNQGAYDDSPEGSPGPEILTPADSFKAPELASFPADTISYIPLKIAPPSFGWAGPKEKTVIPPRAVMNIVSLVHEDISGSLGGSGRRSLREKNLALELQGLFLANDVDGDGFLHRAELLVCLKMIGLPTTDKLVRKYIPVSFSAAQTAAQRKGSGAGIGQVPGGKARVDLAHFVAVTLAELTAPGNDGEKHHSGGAVMQQVQADLELLLKRGVSEDSYDAHMSLRALRHYLTEIVSKADAAPRPAGKTGAGRSTLSRKEYNHFLRAAGVLQDTGGSKNNALLLAARETEFGIDYDAFIRELLVDK